ncbi:hypothetical protein BDA96_03G273000 [Sorghum bicolor]|jgi:hypothetical protein|uniref:RNase H type-1 domain-containing protein n=2 Tax=Sorghum bicolor TaxID=4558 RepID=A0A921UNQ8_SORBI|nr:hypothetical protein BDA96_03G273000 [Sorghum bicolor]OQU87313.1 hypothetical protein SORBI_3003G252750 [Sorghum bicolor]
MEAIRRELADSTTARDMMEKVLKMEAKTQTQVVLLLWLWWGERNKWREEERRRSGVEVAYVAAALADRAHTSQLQKPILGRVLLDERQIKAWARPALDTLKLNSDGAFFEQSGEGGWGFVISDHHGSVQKAGSGRE